MRRDPAYHGWQLQLPQPHQRVLLLKKRPISKKGDLKLGKGLPLKGNRKGSRHIDSQIQHAAGKQGKLLIYSADQQSASRLIPWLVSTFLGQSKRNRRSSRQGVA